MHDTAVRTANFTECVPAPTGRGKHIAVDRRRSAWRAIHQPHQRPLAVGTGLTGIGTKGLHLMRRADLRRAWSMISRSNCLWSA
jgi:hypothetical protein